jgi:hypothetical protein
MTSKHNFYSVAIFVMLPLFVFSQQGNKTDRTLGGFVDSNCHIDKLPSISFAKGNAILSAANKILLDSVAQLLLANPRCKIIVQGHPLDASSYRSNQLSWDRVYTIVNYLVDNRGILSTHIIFDSEETGDDSNIVNLTPTIIDGPNMRPPPHPFYSTIKNLKYEW